MKVWLGGATGFLGSHVADALVDAGHEVCAVSRSGGELASGEVVGSVDVLDEDAVRRSAEGSSHAVVCVGKVSRDPSDAALLHRLHVEGTRSTLRGLRAAGVRRVVLASTSGTIAVSKDPKRIDDERSGAPLKYIASFPYYRTKYFGEKEALNHIEDDFEIVIVNPSLLLGPGDLRESSTLDVRRFLEGAVLMSPAGGLAFEIPHVADLDPKVFRDVVETDVFGFFNIVKATLPAVRQGGGGSYVALVTTAVHSTLPGDALSAVPKASVKVLADQIALEEGENGIRANSVGPGVIGAAGMVLPMYETSARELLDAAVSMTPLRRSGTVLEVAEAVAFLASSRASYINGLMVKVDGGLKT